MHVQCIERTVYTSHQQHYSVHVQCRFSHQLVYGTCEIPTVRQGDHLPSGSSPPVLSFSRYFFDPSPSTESTGESPLERERQRGEGEGGREG